MKTHFTGPDEKTFEDKTIALGCELYSQLKERKGNLLFSPLSISCALAAVRAGARGETAAQIERILRTPLGGKQGPLAFAGAKRRLNAARNGEQVQAEIANSLWVQKSFSLRLEYMETVRKYYDTAVMPVDYADDPSTVAAQLNAWAQKKTRGSALNPMGVPTADTRLVLVNAACFSGRWLSPFKPYITQPEVFHAAKKATELPFMLQTGEFGYGQTENLQILELPYKGEKFSLFLLLPAEKPGALEALEEELSPESLAQWTALLTRQNVQVFLPKFKLTWGLNSLTEALKALGMCDAFSEVADLGDMSPEANLRINELLHQSEVEVEEGGTPVTAETGKMWCLSVDTPPQDTPLIFRANRPFLFLIRDNVETTLLFMGRLTNPDET